MRCRTDKPIQFRFAVVETCVPYRIDWYQYDPRSREIALEKWSLEMDNLIECERTGIFQDPHDHVLTVSPWDVGADVEGELVDIGEAL